jgi:hypothetical protein
MSIDFEVAGENGKVAGKLMQTAQTGVQSKLRALYRRGSGGSFFLIFFKNIAMSSE